MRHIKWNRAAGWLLLASAALALTALPANAQYDYPEECYDIEYESGTMTFGGIITLPTKHEVSRRLKDECIIPPDDRINAQDAAPAAAIYCTASGVSIWDINIISQGEFSFLVPYDTLASAPANPETNTLIQEHGGFQLYRLTSGELQLNSPPDWQGKSYVFTWPGCTPPATN